MIVKKKKKTKNQREKRVSSTGIKQSKKIGNSYRNMEGLLPNILRIPFRFSHVLSVVHRKWAVRRTSNHKHTKYAIYFFFVFLFILGYLKRNLRISNKTRNNKNHVEIDRHNLSTRELSRIHLKNKKVESKNFF